MKKIKKIPLILGSLPLPIGGLSIHVQRLLELLKENKIDYKFYNLKNNRWRLLLEILKAQKIILHTSNVYFRFLLTFIGKALNKDISYVLHGDLGRYKSPVKNLLDRYSVFFAGTPVLLNERSFEKAKLINSNSKLGSSFIPPLSKAEIDLDHETKRKITEIKSKTNYLFCTNAYNFSIDKSGEEIYGILELIDLFAKKKELGLIISDPSGAYSEKILTKNISLGANIMLISKPHSFFRVLELCDASVRNTTTDGDSLSVKESLFLGKYTYCTDVVSRPPGCIIYSKGNLKKKISAFPADKTRIRVFHDETKKKLKDTLQLYTN